MIKGSVLQEDVPIINVCALRIPKYSRALKGAMVNSSVTLSLQPQSLTFAVSHSLPINQLTLQMKLSYFKGNFIVCTNGELCVTYTNNHHENKTYCIIKSSHSCISSCPLGVHVPRSHSPGASHILGNIDVTQLSHVGKRELTDLMPKMSCCHTPIF